MEISAITWMDFGGPFSILLAMAMSCLLFLHFTAKKRFAGLPPGPPTLPFIGNMLQVDVKDLIPSLREVSWGRREKYGAYGGKLFVVYVSIIYHHLPVYIYIY